MKITCIYSIS